MRFSPKLYIKAIKENLELPQFKVGFGSVYVWPRPPLLSQTMLGDLRLSEFNRVMPKAKFNAEDFISFSDQYLATFILRPEDFIDPDYPEDDPDPIRWLRSRMELTGEVKEWLLPGQLRQELRKDVWRHYATLLWWISNAGYELHLSETEMWLKVAGVEIGFRDGQTLCSDGDYCLPVAGAPNWKALLAEFPPGGGSRCRSSAWNALYRQAYRVKSPEQRNALCEALCILQHRTHDMMTLERALFIKEDNRKDRYKISVKKIRDMADELEFLDDPYKRMKTVLVPACMDAQKFSKVFGTWKSDDRPERSVSLMWRNIVYDYFKLDFISDQSPKKKRRASDTQTETYPRAV